MKKTIGITGLIASAILLFTACTAPEKKEVVDMEQLKAEIQAMEDAYAAGGKAKDADAVVAYYSDDAVSYGRNQVPLQGKAAIREDMASGFAKDTTGGYSVYKVVDLYAEGNMAVEIGSWTEFDAAGNEKEKGHYMSYFEKRDGKYVCVRDMNVSSSPIKSETPAMPEMTEMPE